MIALRGLTWDHPRGYAPLIALADLYHVAHPDVTIGWDTGPFACSSHDRIDQLAQRYDLVIYDHPLVGAIAATGALLPLESYVAAADLDVLASQSVGASHRSYDYAGHQWGLAIDAAAQVSAYRPDLLTALGMEIPHTWDDVVELGRALRKQRRGYLALPSGGVNACMSFLTLCANAGEDPCPPHGDRVASPATTRYALEVLREMFELSHPAARAWGPPQALDYMSSHDDAPYCPLVFGYSNYARDGVVPRTLRFTTIPAAGKRGPWGAILGGTGIGVSRHCRHPQAAIDLALWLCGAPIQRGPYVREGGQPGNRDAWMDADANAICHDFFADTLAGLDAAYLRPRYDSFVLFQDRAGDLLNAFLRDGGSVETAMRDLDTLYQARRTPANASW